MADMLATPEELASLLQETNLDRATCELLLEGATAQVQAACGQRLLQVVDDELVLYLDEVNEGEWLTLPEMPVTAISSVTVGGTEVTDWSPNYTGSKIYRLLGWRSATPYCSYGPSSVTVVYTHGYPEGHQRLQLAKSAVLALACQGFTNPAGAVREQIDDYSVQYAESLARMQPSPELALALRNYYGRRNRSVRLVSR